MIGGGDGERGGATTCIVFALRASDLFCFFFKGGKKKSSSVISFLHNLCQRQQQPSLRIQVESDAWVSPVGGAK